MKGKMKGDTSVYFAKYLKGIEMCLEDLEKTAHSAGLNELADSIEAARQEAESVTKKEAESVTKKRTIVKSW